MAQTAKTQSSRLTPSPKALQKALAQSAKQAQLLAQAFGVTVPTTKTKPVSSTRPTQRISLVERNSDRLAEPDAPVDGLWAKEADDRLDELLHFS